MRVAVTGATGFVGRHIVKLLASQGHVCRAWYRPESDRGGFEETPAELLEWVPGELANPLAAQQLVAGCDAVVHAALQRTSPTFQGGESDLVAYLQQNLIGTVQLIEEAKKANVGRFILISTCAVHDKILEDRPLDEAHPRWPKTHYGAHKAALEMFVHSYGWGEGYPICALRPCGVYGLERPVEDSKWYNLIRSVVRGEEVLCQRGGKEVHVGDVAQAVSVLLQAEGIAGEAYNCCDLYVSEFEVATIARQVSGSSCKIMGQKTTPKNIIQTSKLEALGFQFGRRPLWGGTMRQLIRAVQEAEGK